VDVAGGGEVGANGLDGVIRDACIAGDDVTEVHLDLEVFVGEDDGDEEGNL